VLFHRQFVVIFSFWIGLRKNSEGARWLGSDADLSYSAWKAEPTENNSCVVLDRDGYWSVQPCHDNHFALCRKQECYRDWDLLSYQGKVSYFLWNLFSQERVLIVKKWPRDIVKKKTNQNYFAKNNKKWQSLKVLLVFVKTSILPFRWILRYLGLLVKTGHLK